MPLTLSSQIRPGADQRGGLTLQTVNSYQTDPTLQVFCSSSDVCTDSDKQQLYEPPLQAQNWLVGQKVQLEAALTSISAVEPPIEGVQGFLSSIQRRLHELSTCIQRLEHNYGAQLHE